MITISLDMNKMNRKKLTVQEIIEKLLITGHMIFIMLIGTINHFCHFLFQNQTVEIYTIKWLITI